MNQNLYPSFVRGWLAVAAFILTLGGVASVQAQEELEGRGDLFSTVSVPAGLGEAEIKQAIINTLNGREWGLRSYEGNTVVAYLKHRSNEAKVTLEFDNAGVRIYCVGWEINKKTGVRKKPEQPTGWLKNIQGDLTKHFNRALTQK